MCGIIGYIGNQPCVDLIFDGLRRLEYRGYDSAGIATLSDGQIHLVKSEGKLVMLEPEKAKLPNNATVGLGHTRWATHGPPTTINAHPHVSERMALVHNGIIENYSDLKAGLVAGGVNFSSETDSEVVLHLLAKEYKQKADMPKSIMGMLEHLKGAYSLGILIPEEPDAIYLVKQGSPLVIGLGENEAFFASDIAALVNHTKKAVILQDGQFARLKADSVAIWDFHGKEIDPEVTQLDWTSDAVEKGGYPHFMLKEIHEQPAVVAKITERLLNLKTGQINFSELGLDTIDTSRVSHINIVACGTAYLSGVLGKYMIERYAKIPVNVEIASEFRYREPYVDEKSLFIAVSQSGETADTLASLKHAKARGAQVLSFCNVRHSEIPRLSDATVYMDCGPEIGVASTKAFVAMVLCQWFFAEALAQKRGIRDQEELSPALAELKSLPHHLQSLIDRSDQIRELAASYFDTSHFLFLGRGENFAIAYEGALKLKEISYIHAEAYGAGELKHGPIALVDPYMPIMAIAPQDSYYDKTIANIEEVKARQGRVIGVGYEGDVHLKRLCDDVIGCPKVATPAFQALINIIPLQLFSYHAAVLRGTDVDQPRNLAKSVTVE